MVLFTINILPITFIHYRSPLLTSKLIPAKLLLRLANPPPSPEPHYLVTLEDGNTWVSPDYLTYYPIYITTGVLDAAVYKEV